MITLGLNYDKDFDLKIKSDSLVYGTRNQLIIAPMKKTKILYRGKRELLKGNNQHFIF